MSDFCPILHGADRFGPNFDPASGRDNNSSSSGQDCYYHLPQGLDCNGSLAMAPYPAASSHQEHQPTGGHSRGGGSSFQRGQLFTNARPAPVNPSTFQPRPAEKKTSGYVLDDLPIPSPVSVALVGNPGSGKSTIQNCLAGAAVFRSGVSFGTGLTYKLDIHKTAGGHTLYDTPGVSDNQKREAAAFAIQDMLQKGGDYKLLFVIREHAGRVVEDDVTTMRLVLEAAPAVGSNYGVIINQVKPEMMLSFQADPESMLKFCAVILCALPDESRTKHITIMLEDEDLCCKDNVVKPLPDRILQFIVDCPTVKRLDPSRVGNIGSAAFDSRREETAALLRRNEQLLAENEAMKQNRHSQTESDRWIQFLQTVLETLLVSKPIIEVLFGKLR